MEDKSPKNLPMAINYITEFISRKGDQKLKDVWGVLMIKAFLPEFIAMDPSLEDDKFYKDFINDKDIRNLESKINKLFDESKKTYSRSPSYYTIPGRRLKGKVHKKSGTFRRLNKCDRDVVIRWWNHEQRMVLDDDPICVELTKNLNLLQHDKEPLTSMQIPGFFSYLCRLALMGEPERSRRISKMIKRGDASIAPRFTEALIECIGKNYEREKEERYRRAKDHEEIRKKRYSSSYESSTPKPEPTVEVEEEIVPDHMIHEPTLEAKSEVEGDFDIKFM